MWYEIEAARGDLLHLVEEITTNTERLRQYGNGLGAVLCSRPCYRCWRGQAHLDWRVAGRPRVLPGMVRVFASGVVIPATCMSMSGPMYVCQEMEVEMVYTGAVNWKIAAKQ